jgi:hypothetical protein
MKGGFAGTKSRPAGVKSNPADGKSILAYKKGVLAIGISDPADRKSVPAD